MRYRAVLVALGLGLLANAQSSEKPVEDFLKLKFGMFIHFNMGTFHEKEWVEPGQDPKSFIPAKLDCGQWADAAKSAGMNYAVLTTKHHDGFCLWDSKTTTYDVASSAVAGRDIVKEYCDAFRSRGIEPHFYFSIWDRQLGIENGITADEMEVIKAQLKELLSNYGEIGSITFDGWGNCGTTWKQEQRDEINEFVKSLQPQILITDHYQLRRGLPLDAAFENVDFFHYEEPWGEWAPEGNTYPSQQGPCIQSQWFWKLKFPEEELMSVDDIVNRHLVVLEERNCNFLLNCAPNRDGLMDDNVVHRLAEVGRAYEQVAAGEDYDFNAMLQPIPATARFSDPDYNIWGGSAVKGDDGKYHLFYSRWPRRLGHNAWVTHSEIAHAVSDSPFGPWKHHDVALPARGTDFWDGSCTHNPTVIRAGGKYYLYYMGNYGDGVPGKSLNWTHRNNQRIGVAVADSPNGPWTRFDKPLVDTSDGFYDALCCNNPSVAVRPDGGCLMVYKAVGDQGKLPFGGPVVHCVATSDNPTGPFRKHPDPIFVKEGVTFAAEDPFIWRGKDRYWAVVKDNAGHFTNRGYSLALWESVDGIDWKLSKHPLVITPEVIWADGGKQRLEALERPQVLLENGRPIALFCAAADTKDRDGSFNVQVPLGINNGK